MRNNNTPHWWNWAVWRQTPDDPMAFVFSLATSICMWPIALWLCTFDKLYFRLPTFNPLQMIKQLCNRRASIQVERANVMGQVRYWKHMIFFFFVDVQKLLLKQRLFFFGFNNDRVVWLYRTFSFFPARRDKYF